MFIQPHIKLRKLRRTETLRAMVQELRLSLNDFMYPMFVVDEGAGVKRPISTLADQYHLSPDMAAQEAKRLFDLGLKSVILFGLPKNKDAQGSSGSQPLGPVQMAVKAIKKAVPTMVVATDVCLCEYTDHGHCGLINKGEIDNDLTLPHLAAQALSHAEAGCDIVAPSDMMDGRVAHMAQTLAQNGFAHIPIMAYSVKYASAFYGPFREAASSTPAFGDRRSYQMDPARPREAFLEMDSDVAEGADILMVKPAGIYLDIIRQARDRYDLPLAAYQVSGEFAMIMAASQNGLLNEKEAALESLLAIKRAGADIIISYFAPKIPKWLEQ
ncbi:MAG: porphobilinogen synthase [Candidatus Adiutrix sp.]